LPFEVGGGPSSSEAAYVAMREAVGQGGYAAEGTIEAAWRWARARGLRGAFCDGRAALCYFPDRTVDAIAVYEEILQLTSAPTETDEERRAAIVDKWIGLIDVSTSSLEDELQKIDSRFSILEHDFATSTTTQRGRAFEDWDPTDPLACGPDFGVIKSTMWPNYSTEFVCQIMYALPVGPISTDALHCLDEAKTLLNEALPAWVDFEFTRTQTGFLLDIDLLDLEGFGS